jgi:hypothetical protein
LRHIREIKKKLKVTTMNNSSNDDDENKVDERKVMNELGYRRPDTLGGPTRACSPRPWVRCSWAFL